MRGADRGSRRHGARRAFSRWIFRRLDTTPGQEKVISGVLEDLEGVFRGARSVGRDTGEALAQAVGSSAFDEETVEASWREQDDTIRNFREATVDALKAVHEVLDDRQREVLSNLLATGPCGHRMAHC
jgi:Spy/CpxP family protein refolding chaperone